MNIKTLAEIDALSSTALREYAKEIGVKRAANDTKFTLMGKVLKKVAELELEAAEAAKIAKAAAVAKGVKAAKAKLCTIPDCTRKQSTTVIGPEMCDLHLEEGGWENEHQDQQHDEVAEEIARGGELTPEWESETKGCWICHPELNPLLAEETPAEANPRSKAGMVVLAKGTYIHKSDLVCKEIIEAGGEIVKLSTKDDKTQLLAKWNGVEIVAGWTGDAFNYALASWDGKKYRNVKELVRLLGRA